MINNSLPWVSEQDDETLLNGSECACVSHATKISVDTGIKAVKAHKSFPLNAMSSGLGKETEICECVLISHLNILYPIKKSQGFKKKKKEC